MGRLHIVVDDRERQPWGFGDLAEVSRGRLPTGDYALEGDLGFAIERKSLDDYIGTISSGWQNFRAELERMKRAGFPARAVIVEADWSDVVKGAYNHPEIKPPFILKRTGELIYSGVCVCFASNPTTAAGLAWKILAVRGKDIFDDSENKS